MQDTDKKVHGGAGRGQGRKKKVREETKSVHIVMPISLAEWLKFNHNDDDVSSFVVKCILKGRAEIEKMIRETDRAIEEHNLPL